MSATRAETYLTLPLAYAARVGGLCWSAAGDAVERWNGTTLALTEEVAAVLEGVFARPPVPPFVVVLHALHLMRADDSAPVSARLRAAFGAAAGAPARFRNAGALVAELCAGLPPAPHVQDWREVDGARVRRRLFGAAEYPLLADEPAASPAAVEAHIAARLDGLSDADLDHWFAHGCAPGAAGAKLAEEVESLPARVARLLAVARTRPRLVGAAAVVPAVDAALSLPPRHRSPDAVPQGGYADVTTRGDPDRLLPSQFALDPDEFVRRFAENELLYFQREEPQAGEKPDRLVVLDQGVRTWGPVRLALAAAAVVLLRKDAHRLGRVLLAATSADGVFDVATADPEALADLLEGSDLGESPRDCWAAALADPSPGPRDVILLTHPRTARDPALVAAPRRPGDRVFALTVGDDGGAELAEWGAAGPGPGRTFRVDLAAAEAARPDGPAAPRVAGVALDTAWAGDVEPVGFPFRPGLVCEPTRFGFDAAGEWLVIAGPQGVLHGLALDGRPPEVLPRAFAGGAVLKQVEAVLPLADGVAVCGRVENPSVVKFVVAHYDHTTRRVRAHDLGPAGPADRWQSRADDHVVVVRRAGRPVATPLAVDLASGLTYPPAGGDLPDRVVAAVRRTYRTGSPPHALAVLTEIPPGGGPANGEPYLVLKGNTICLPLHEPEWRPFEPRRDGKPLLAGAVDHRAQLAGDVLALSVGSGAERRLVFLRGPGGNVIGEVPLVHANSPFTLSPDGRLVARLKPSRTVVVSDTAGVATARAVAAPAGLHNNLAVSVAAAPFTLALQVGSSEHVFTVVNGELRHELHTPIGPPPRLPGAGRAAPGYDPARFPPNAGAADGGVVAVLDRLGQVLVFAAGGGLVASFLVRRELAAAWAPGGVLWGSAALLGAPPTPDAARRLGAALGAMTAADGRR